MESTETKSEEKVSKQQFVSDFLARLVGNRKQIEVAEEYGIPKGTLNGWIKGRAGQNPTFPPAYDILQMTKGDYAKAAWLCFGATAKEPAMAKSKPSSSAQAEQPAPHQRIPLTQEEEDAVLSWMLQMAETSILEYPVTIALRKIATRIADDSARASSAQKKGGAHEAKDASGKEAATEPTPSPPKNRSPRSASDIPPDKL